MNKSKTVLDIEQKFESELGDLLKKLYVDEKKTAVEISEMFGVDKSSIGKYLKKYDIPVRSISEIKLKGRQKPTKDQLIQYYLTEKKSTIEIGEMFDLNSGTVGKYLKKYEIPIRSISETRLKGKSKPSEEQLRQLYITQKKFVFEIAELLGVGNSSVSRWLKEYSIPIRPISDSILGGKQKPNGELLTQWYQKEKKSIEDIAESVGVSESAITNWLREANVPIRTISESKLKGRQKPGENQLRQLYINEKKTTYEIAEMIGVTGACVNHWLKNYNIPIRNQDSNNELKRQALEKVLEAYLK